MPPSAQAPSHARQHRGMSRRRLLLASNGAFLLVFGLLLRLYVAPALVAAPVSIYLKFALVSPHSTFFNEAALATEHGPLTFTITVRGDPAASSRDVAVWDSYSVLADPKNGAVVTSTYQRAAFNRRTAELVKCCGASINDDTQIAQRGIGVDWPIGVRKHTYELFDANSQSTWPAHFRGTATIDGVQTYKFTQHIPNEVVAQMAGVPSSLLGLRGPSRNVVANRFYEADNTFYVDPVTGVVIKIQEKIDSVLHGPGGQGTLVGADVDLKLTPASTHSLAALATREGTQIKAVQQTGPVALGVLGLLLLLIATVRFRRRRRVPADGGDDDDDYFPGDDDGREPGEGSWREHPRTDWPSRSG
jgi:hypothetical protein